MVKTLDIAIIGPGKVGTAVGILAARAGLRVTAVAGRTKAHARAAASAIGPGVRVCTPRQAASAGKLVLLAVNDEAVAPLCLKLAQAGAFRKGAVVAHCAGALNSHALKPAAECGCFVGSMHPLQTFPTVEAAVAKMPGAYCFIEGDRRSTAALTKLAVAIGGIPVRIAGRHKVLHHAAAVVACNFVTALLGAAMRIAAEAKIDRQTFLAAFAPLVRSTIDNVFSMGPAEALTGPIARGDFQTVARHLKALKNSRAGAESLYAMLSAETAFLAYRKGTLSASKIMDLAEVLKAAADDVRPAKDKKATLQGDDHGRKDH